MSEQCIAEYFPPRPDESLRAELEDRRRILNILTKMAVDHLNCSQPAIVFAPDSVLQPEPVSLECIPRALLDMIDAQRAEMQQLMIQLHQRALVGNGK